MKIQRKNTLLFIIISDNLGSEKPTFRVGLNMPYAVKSHAQARLAICCVCWRKAGNEGRVVNGEIEFQVQKFVFDGYFLANNSYPTGICGSCRVGLKRYEVPLNICYNCVLLSISVP